MVGKGRDRSLATKPHDDSHTLEKSKYWREQMLLTKLSHSEENHIRSPQRIKMVVPIHCPTALVEDGFRGFDDEEKFRGFDDEDGFRGFDDSQIEVLIPIVENKEHHDYQDAVRPSSIGKGVKQETPTSELEVERAFKKGATVFGPESCGGTIERPPSSRPKGGKRRAAANRAFSVHVEPRRYFADLPCELQRSLTAFRDSAEGFVPDLSTVIFHLNQYIEMIPALLRGGGRILPMSSFRRLRDNWKTGIERLVLTKTLERIAVASAGHAGDAPRPGLGDDAVGGAADGEDDEENRPPAPRGPTAACRSAPRRRPGSATAAWPWTSTRPRTRVPDVPGSAPTPTAECEQCGRRCPFAARLRDHMLTHTGAKPFACTVCRKAFRQRRQLRAHARIHTGERPYGCEVCGKGFTTGHSRTTHIATHAERRPSST